MSKIFTFLTIFSIGYVVNDLFGENNIYLISKADAEVAGMGYYDLRKDRDFKKAVRYIVEQCSISGDVNGDLLHSTRIDC
jgi:hypothetical protein